MSDEFRSGGGAVGEEARKTEPASALHGWLLGLSADHRVIVPAVKAGNRVYEEISTSGLAGLDLPQDRTILPFRKFLLPPEEALFSFAGNSLVPGSLPVDKTILFGLRICELSSDRLLGSVMAGGNTDYPFAERRRNMLTIGVECHRTAGCFCEKTGHDRVAEGDFDLFVAGDATGTSAPLRLIPGTGAGVRLAAGAPLPLADGKGSAQFTAPPPEAGAGRWPLEDLPEKMRRSFGAVMWDELAERCLGCGNCTVVCPLCYCFTTRDETGLDPAAGRRLRLWDSCQLVGFARVAGGHNFRQARSERIWYRFSHKFMRMTASFGLPGCSGCGACLHFCPAEIDPRAVIESVLEGRAGD